MHTGETHDGCEVPGKDYWRKARCGCKKKKKSKKLGMCKER